MQGNERAKAITKEAIVSLANKYLTDENLIKIPYFSFNTKCSKFEISHFSKKQNFTRFAKSKLSTTKNGKLNVEILKGQESFRIKSFVKSNIWVLLPAGKSKFKKGDILDCFFPNHSNQSLI